MCSGSRVGSSLNGPSSSLPLWSGDSWVSFTELSDGWHDHGKTPFNPPHCLQLEKQTEWWTGKKGMVLFFVICMILKLQESNSLWLQRFNHYCLFSEHEINYRKEERKKNWVRQACVCVFERSSLCCLVYALSSHTIFYTVLFMLPWAKRSNVIINYCGNRYNT